MSVRTKDEKIAIAVEALRRAKSKFAGRQKVHVSSPEYGNQVCVPVAHVLGSYFVLHSGAVVSRPGSDWTFGAR